MTRISAHSIRSWLACITATVGLLSLSCSGPRMYKTAGDSANAESMADYDADGVPDSADMDGDMEGEGGEEEAKEADKDTGKSGKGKRKTWKRSTLVANTSRLLVGDRDELPIRGMQMRAQVDGFRARVLIDFFFENTYDRQLEGTFSLRLPPGAAPYFLAFGQEVIEDKREAERPTLAIAMDPSDAVRAQSMNPSQIMVARAPRWQQPKEARMVPREQAALAYKSTVRRRVDPALMEWAGAGVFNARIFPIAGRRIHRVVVGYDVNLTRIGDDLELALPVPKDIPMTALDIDVGALDGVAVKLTAEVDGYGVRVPTTADKLAGREYYRLDGLAGMLVNLRLKKTGALALVGSDADEAKGAHTGQYFTARVTPNLPESQPESQNDNQKGGVERAIFLVDTSLSANPDKFNIWLQLLRSILEQNRAGSLRHFAVLFFNIDTHWWRPQFVANTPANVEALMKSANQLALEGATDLSAALAEASVPEWQSAIGQQPARELFLLSDGAATWGEGDAFYLSSGLSRPEIRGLYAYRTGMAGDDSRMLGHLARESGGALFSVVGESEIERAASAHTKRPWRIDGVKVTGGADVIIAGRPQVLFPGQRVFLAGRGAPKGASKGMITFELSQGERKLKVDTPLAHTLASPLAARSYGQIAVNQLEEFLGFTDSFAEAYARHFRVTGKTTSLLMLETEEDYRRFGIRPQNDMGVIKASPVGRLVGNALAELKNVLGDAKFGFTRRTLGRHKLSEQVRSLLEQLPTSAFAVQVPPLRSRHHSRAGVNKGLLKQLRENKPEYDTVSAEAVRRRDRYSPADGLVALSSLVEARPGDGVLARDVGYTAMEWGLSAHAYHLFRRVARARPFEPQSFHAMARALASMGKRELALAYYEIALQGEWDSRFGDFKQIVTVDYLRFLRIFLQDDPPPSMVAYARQRESELGQGLGLGNPELVITMTWNTDSTDVDLHVIEPSGEECFYSHRRTRSGGRMTQDVTQGYGPEMYTLRKAPRGLYRVRAKYFASDANRTSARTKVYVSVYRYWGSQREKAEHKVVTLEYGKDMHEVFAVRMP